MRVFKEIVKNYRRIVFLLNIGFKSNNFYFYHFIKYQIYITSYEQCSLHKDESYTKINYRLTLREVLEGGGTDEPKSVKN